MTSRNATTLPCQRSRSTRAFIDPDNSPDNSIRAAIALCESCPIRQQCAADALNAGAVFNIDRDTIRTIGPARGVIQAGVVCQGDKNTARQLAEIAGVEVPKYKDKVTTPQPRGNCIACGTPMVGWTRHPEDIPTGYNMHHAQNYCFRCKTPYREMLKRGGRRRLTLGGQRAATDERLDKWLRDWLPRNSPALPIVARMAARDRADIHVGVPRLKKSLERIGARSVKLGRLLDGLTKDGKPKRSQPRILWTMPSTREPSECSWERTGRRGFLLPPSLPPIIAPKLAESQRMQANRTSESTPRAAA